MLTFQALDLRQSESGKELWVVFGLNIEELSFASCGSMVTWKTRTN